MQFGDNGLFNKSKKAVEKYKEESAKEKISMSMGEFLFDINSGNMTKEEKDNHLKEILSNLGATSIATDSKYYEVEVDEYIFWIDRESLEIISQGPAIVIPPTSIEVKSNSSNIDLIAGETAIINLELTPPDASLRLLKYTSSDEKVATVNNGIVKGVSKGTTTITIESTENSNIKATCEVTVTEIEVESITLDKTELKLAIGESSENLAVTFNPTNASNKNIIWSSSEDGVATVDDKGKITGLTEGAATVTATTSNGKTATCTVTVEDMITKRAGDITIKPKYDYGKVVTGYNSKTEGLTWRLWYVDNVDENDKSKDTVYLIGDFIQNYQAPTKTVNGSTYSVLKSGNYNFGFCNGSGGKDGVIPAYTHNAETNNIGSASKWIWDNQQEIASRWLSKWYEDNSHKTSGDDVNMRAVAYMLDSEIWTSAFGDTENKANYAIGGPTLEMYAASYNDSSPRKSIELRINNDLGYELSWNENGNIIGFGINSIHDINDNGYGIFVPNKSGCNFWCLAAPVSYEIRVYNANSSAKIVDDYVYRNYYCMRPIVCLKPGIQIEPSEDGFAIK